MFGDQKWGFKNPWRTEMKFLVINKEISGACSAIYWLKRENSFFPIVTKHSLPRGHFTKKPLFGPPNQTKDLRGYRHPTTSAVDTKITRLGNSPSHRLILQGQWVIIEILVPHLLFWKTNIRVKLIAITIRLIIEALLNGHISKSGRLNIAGDKALHKSPCDELIKKPMQEKSSSLPRYTFPQCPPEVSLVPRLPPLIRHSDGISL
ncbi:hypothetical protein ROZALSC1DRAFT_22463 [Rozella allomycis CSF55]|uniref:Uncharacterized protein n=1 Tax=Rozella allomycis (strain CSF55) TaxID=988480 RepID=A0A4P9YL58_ROZAC|nr:hypothetical protein ROZALSC1DRAFT_22463 [Rozella allomycis CSF55]